MWQLNEQLGQESKRACCSVHSIMLLTQRLSSRPRSIRPQQLPGHIETLLSLTTSQSIAADYWLKKLTGVSDASVLRHFCTWFSHNECKIHKCNQWFSDSSLALTQCTIHSHTVTLDNLAGRQVTVQKPSH